MRRVAIVRNYLDDGVSLATLVAMTGSSRRTIQRWVTRYQAHGVDGLIRRRRQDAGQSRMRSELADLIRGLALQKARPSAATIQRRVAAIARQRGWKVPAYSTVYAVVRAIDPHLLTLAHEGGASFRDRYELVHRHRASGPNVIWQADHTALDLLILDENGQVVRPWLTVITDDHSRAVAGFMVFVGAPSALNTSLALRQAIWRKANPNWQICGIPEILYVDHGSDFTSDHIEQVAVGLKFRIIHSAVARPQGRGKVERLFRTINTELLPQIPGHLVDGKPVTPPRLSLADLDRTIEAYITDTYHQRVHTEIKRTPLDAWRGDGFLPHLPESLELLDLLLVMHVQPRTVRRDGISFMGMRFMSPTLAGFVGKTVTVRYDPRDLSDIRVFHGDAFVCRAVSTDRFGAAVTLKDIQAARRAHRKALRSNINEYLSHASSFDPDWSPKVTPPVKPSPPAKPKLRLYEEGDE